MIQLNSGRYETEGPINCLDLPGHFFTFLSLNSRIIPQRRGRDILWEYDERKYFAKKEIIMINY